MSYLSHVHEEVVAPLVEAVDPSLALGLGVHLELVHLVLQVNVEPGEISSTGCDEVEKSRWNR